MLLCSYATSCGRALSSGDVRTTGLAMDSISSRLSGGSLSGRRLSNSLASTSGREPTRRRGRSRLQVDAALFEPPPFQPAKLSVEYLPGAAVSNSARISSSTSTSRPLPRSRRYTLTHNDITGALNLSIGNEYNDRQVQGFYTRILRDEITAEWLFGAGSGSIAPAELHIYCHVSGEERWLAPPQLRNFIFRREMNLVLDTFLYADQQLLQAFPDLLRAKVYVHFQSDVQDLDLREYWGVLGERTSWRRMPKGVLARLKLLLFGFPALPHQRPRHALTHLQQLQQQGTQPGGVVAAAAAATATAAVAGGVAAVAASAVGAGGVAAAAAAATAAGAGGVAAVAAVTTSAAAAVAADDAAIAEHSTGSGTSSSSSPGHHQWQPQAELAVDSTRPVALSLQEQRQQAQAQHTQQQQHGERGSSIHLEQQQQLTALAAAPPPAEPCSCCSCAEGAVTSDTTTVDTSSCDGQSQPWGHEQQQPQQQQCLQAEQCGPQADVANTGAPTATSNSTGSNGSSSAGSAANSNGTGSNGSSSGGGPAGQVDTTLGFDGTQQQRQRQQQQQQRLQDQLDQAAMVEALSEYGRWSVRQQQSQQLAGSARERQLVQASGSSSSGSSRLSGSSSSSSIGSLGGGSSGNVLPASMLGGPTALQLVLQQQQEQMLLKTAVVMATANAVVDATSNSRCQ